ncbi:MAG: PorP/SprF family type IX secretion system membrane protein [Cytophagales bacterium]|nr:PorP/SprF family type IX secretion system membrane protein [Cytophagales bacterium]
MFTKNISVLLGCLGVAMLLGTEAARAQNMYYSQYLRTPLFNNPTDVTRGNARQVILSYRRQGTGEEDNVITPSLTYAQPFLSRETGRKWGGMGLAVVHEKAGYEGMLQHAGAVAAYAHHVYLSDKFTFSGGLQLGLFRRGLDLSRLTTGSQYVNGAYDPGAALGENLTAGTRTYLSITPGLSWAALDEAGENKAFLGVSLFNANRPNASFTEKADRMATNLVLSGSYRVLRKGAFDFTPTFRYIRERSSSQTNIGALSRFNFASPGGLLKTGGIGLGTWYSVNNAAIVSLEITQPSYFINFSYDLPATNKTVTRRVTNAVEVSIGWTMDLKARRKAQKELTSEARQEPAPAHPAQKPGQAAPAPPPADRADNQPATTSQPAATTGQTRQGGSQEAPQPPKAATPLTPAEQKTLSRQASFELGSSELSPASEQLVAEIKAVLEAHPDQVLEISGHTCNIGTDEVNQKVSMERAERVKSSLIKEGISADRIRTVGRSDKYPVASNATEAGRRKNRRVEFKMLAR